MVFSLNPIRGCFAFASYFAKRKIFQNEQIFFYRQQDQTANAQTKALFPDR